MSDLSNSLTIIIRSIISSRLFKTGGVYTLSSIFEKAIPFLLLPVLTRYLTTVDYGIVSMFTVLVGLTIPFTGFNSHSAILRNYFKDNIDLPVYVANSLIVLFVSTIFTSIIYIIFSGFISYYTEFPENWLALVIVAASFQFIINIVLVLWQAKKKALQYGVFKILLTMLNLGLSVYLIVVLSYGWEGRVVGNVVAVIIFGLVGLSILAYRKLIKFKINYGYIKHAIYYGAPLILHVVSGFLITMIDRVFITNMIGVGETGIYTVGYQIGMIIGVLASSFNKAWTPWLFKSLSEGGINIKKKIVKYSYVYMLAMLLLALVLSLIAPWFIQLFIGESFYDSVEYIVWIAFGYAFNGMYFITGNYIFFVEKTYLLSWLTLLTAAINIFLNYLLIKLFGPIGAAQATTITYFILFISTWYLASRVYQMPWMNFTTANK